MTVWVQAWQMQCCGKPFTVGSRVSWTLRPADADYLMMLGGEAGGAIDATEDHHGADLDKGPVTTGTVTAIAAVHCRYAPDPDRDALALYPVASSGVQTPVPMADGWIADRDDLGFAGYLVRLADVEGTHRLVPGADRRTAAELSTRHAVAAEGDPVRDIAAVIGRRLGVPVESVPAQTYGPLGPIFAADQPSSSDHTRRTLGWEPKHPALLEDLENIQP